MSCADPVIWEFSFLRGCRLQGGGGNRVSGSGSGESHRVLTLPPSKRRDSRQKSFEQVKYTLPPLRQAIDIAKPYQLNVKQRFCAHACELPLKAKVLN
jgi:hypothetical protein